MTLRGELAIVLSFSLPAGLGAQSLQLTGTEPPAGVDEFRIDASGTRLVYRENGALLARRLDRAGAPVLLSGSSFVYTGFQLSPDGRWVVFQTGGESEIYSVPFAGGVPVKLNGELEPFEGEVYQNTLQISPDGTRVLYRADENADFIADGHSAPIDGSAPSVKLNTAFGMEVFSLAFSPDSQRIVMIAGDSLEPELYVVPAAGGMAPVQLNQALGGLNGNTRALAFRVTEGSDRVVFWGERDTTGGIKTRLYTVPIDGSAVPLELGGAPGNVRVSPTSGALVPFALAGSRAVYVADQDASNVFELFSVPVDGSAAPVELNAVLVTGGDVSVGSNAVPFQASPDGTRVAYVADQDVNDRFELYSTPIDASAAPTKLSGPLVTGGDVRSLVVSPSSTHVAYAADQDTDGTFELYVGPLDGSAAALRLNGPFTPTVVVPWYGFDAAGRELLYVANQDTATRDELYRARVDGSGAARRLSPATSEGEVRALPAPLAFRGPPGSRVLYTGDLALAGVHDLYLGFLSKPLLPIGTLPGS